MNSDQMKGAAEKASGKVKEGFGKITGNPNTQAEGKVEQAKASYGRISEMQKKL